MIPFTRKLLAVVMVVGLLAPAGAALCAAAAPHGCVASEHSCCQDARLVPCECGSAQQGSGEAEPTQRPQPTASSGIARAIDAHAAPAPILARPVVATHQPPPPDVGKRLSLLATLLV